MALSLTREIAYDIFAEVLFQRKKPEERLEQAYEKYDKKLKRVDRNFIKEILYGSLRWHSKLFWILQHTSKRDLEKSSPEIVAALVVGTYQIYYMDRVPDRAAVNESVEYVRKKGQASACSFVNGILRQIARRAEYFAKPDKDTEPVAYFTVQFAHPKWIVERWSKVFKADRLKTMLSHNNTVPPYSIRANLLKVPGDKIHELQQKILKLESTQSDRRPLRSALRLKSAPRFGQGTLFQQGFYTIQDEASQLVGAMVEPKEGSRILECCAGPGGKLSHIYELGNETLDLVALEKDERQMLRAKETMTRLGHENVKWIQRDFLEYNDDAGFDKILLDAPCSGLGVLRRHPEGKWQKSEQAVLKMAEVQRSMIEHALSLLRPDGELIYSVCSFEREEGEAHLEYLLKKHQGGIEVVSPIGRIPDYYRKYVTRQQMLLIYAGNGDDMDGFASFIIKSLASATRSQNGDS